MSPKLTAPQFENLARQVFSQRFGKPLTPEQVPVVPKFFDLVSLGHEIAYDAKYYTLVGGQHQPLAKFSIFAEYIWLLENRRFSTGF
jgi:hypothetical protein